MNEKPRIFKLIVVDDDQTIVNFAENYSSKLDYLECHGYSSPQDALNWSKLHKFDIAIIDYHMPKMGGLELISKLTKNCPDSYCLLMTGHAELQIAIDAIRTGVFDFITKPFDYNDFRFAIERVIKHVELNAQNKFLRNLLHNSYGKKQLIGKSEAIVSIRDKIKLFGQSDAPVLITGETGVGKEIVARMIHAISKRNQNSFVPVNCSVYAQTLLESELFGHEKGAFTGAERQRIGRFELAKKGTILLDEVAEIPPQLQVKLLRVLQEKEYERVGGNNTIMLLARIISITNRNIEKEINKNRLRKDLLYRLNTLHIHVPPLRERGNDILLLTNCFLKRFSLVYNKKIPSFSDRAKDIILNYPWPGNVRQLENAIEYAVLSCDTEKIYGEHLPEDILETKSPSTSNIKTLKREEDKQTIPAMISNLEREKIIACLDLNKGNKSRTASSLGLSRGQLIYRLKKYDIKITREDLIEKK